MTTNPDILATISQPGPSRPALVIGFAAETEDIIANAIEKRRRKGCDWLLANDVGPNSGIAGGVMGGDENEIHLVTDEGVETWPRLGKPAVADRLARRIAAHFQPGQPKAPAR